MPRLAPWISFPLAIAIASSAFAEDRSQIGRGGLATNDAFADQYDRWRTGSAALSYVWGPEWNGVLPSGFGDILELRLGAEVLTPANIVTPAAGDRPYAGALSFGLHTHFLRKGWDYSIGGDLVVTGPSTGLDDLQDGLHDFVGIAGPSDPVLANQISDDVHPTLVAEIGRNLSVSGSATLRPFVEARAGAETLLRTGFDFYWGVAGRGDLLVRTPDTGQRYRAITSDASGFTFTVGADTALVDSSVFLPSRDGYDLTDTRNRARIGLHWQGDAGSSFYGLTWHGKEFEAQGTDQVTGSVQFNLRF